MSAVNGRRVSAALGLVACALVALLAESCASQPASQAPPGGPQAQVHGPPHQPGIAPAPPPRTFRHDVPLAEDPVSLEASLAQDEREIARVSTKESHPQPKSGGPGKDEDACTAACRALASMKRTSDRLCTLTGEKDERCAKARTRTKNAAATVRAACPSCTA
jgi:hypothetical protein